MEIRWTIFKKVFLILLTSFIVVNIFNIFLDFQITKERKINELSDENLRENIAIDIAGQFNQKYKTLNNMQFLKDIDENDTLSLEKLSYNMFVIDKNYNIIQQKGGFLGKENQSQIMVQIHEVISASSWMNYDRIFMIPEGKTTKAVEDILQDEKVMEVAVAYQENKQDIAIITYLEIDGKVLYGNKNGKQVKEGYLRGFNSQKYSYIYDDSSATFIDHTLLHQDVLEKVKSEKKNYWNHNYETRMTYGYSMELEKNGQIYQIYQIPLLKEGIVYNLDREYTDEEIEGYLVFYTYEYQALSSILDDVIYNKQPLYLISFVLVLIICIFISYMFSRRIKQIDNETKKIAHHDFDVQLNEKSHDELGTLSHHINIMSQNLKTTIDNLNKEIEQVKKLESLRQEFIANFTHEIKTPLGIIDGYIELIHDNLDDKKKEEYLFAIEKEVERINQLVQSMLNLSKLESGHVQLEIQDVDLDDLFITVIDSMITLIKKKNIQVVLEGKESMIQADLFQFEIVIKNFLSNAIKHTPEYGHIYIQYDENHISIENEGPTLTPQQIENIWETYVSGDREGTGLGLAICKSILNLHEFYYSVSNTERGVCFEIQMKKGL